MSVVKKTYALPSRTVAQFESAVKPGQRSAMLARLLDEWVERRRRSKLARAVVEGCRDMADVYLEVEREFHPLEEELTRGKKRRAKPKNAVTSSASDWTRWKGPNKQGSVPR
ncbi:MAG: hypothetical protein HUU46_11610 [Candidatus Hydrogenedentes bacterium]|nr:hypothetical protein [Candidatus Hydrogenedentota bacterium]